MKRRGVYEAGLPASSRRIATSTLIPLAFQLKHCNSGEDACQAQHIQIRRERFDAVEHFAARYGRVAVDPEPPSGRRRRPIITVPARHLQNCVVCCYFHSEFFKVFWFTLAAWTRTQRCTI